MLGKPDPVAALFEDLESQATGLHLDARSGDVTALSVAEYATVTLGSRVLASLGCDVSLRLLGGLSVRGLLVRAGADWLMVEDGQERRWLVPAGSLTLARGFSTRSVPEDTRTVLAKLRLNSALRSLSRGRHSCVIHMIDAQRYDGVITQVGQDFLEVSNEVNDEVRSDPAAKSTWLIPVKSIAAIQSRL